MTTIGDRLKTERSKIGLTQPEVAEMTGVSKKTLIDYEADRTSPDAKFLEVLHAAGADTHFIVTGERVLISKVNEQNAGYILRPEQQALLEVFEHCNAAGQSLVLQVAKVTAQANAQDA